MESIAFLLRSHSHPPCRGYVAQLPSNAGVQNGVRLDRKVFFEWNILSNFDSLFWKFFVRAPTRIGATNKLRPVLDETAVQGVPTTSPFHLEVL